MTKSQAIREAVRAFADREDPAPEARRPYDALKHLIGCARGGPPDLSSRTGEAFRERLEAKRKRW